MSRTVLVCAILVGLGFIALFVRSITRLRAPRQQRRASSEPIPFPGHRRQLHTDGRLAATGTKGRLSRDGIDVEGGDPMHQYPLASVFDDDDEDD